MAFSSIPAYLDPSNWQQQQNHQIIGSSGSGNPLLAQPPLQPHGGPGVGSIRPGSMAERARIANIPLPETALKCPRCESTNTKFCYFNNYSLTQPRHFCKTCRRYWTRGGALRNVPVGGGCRRNNKRTKQSSSSPTTSNNNNKATTDRAHQPNNNNNNNNNKNPSSVDPTTTTGGGTEAAANMLGFPQLRFMSSMSSPLRFNEGFGSGGGGEQMGLGGYGGMTAPAEEMGFHGGVEPWRMQQFPFQQEQSTAAGNINYQFSCGGGGESSIMDGGQMMVRPKLTSSMMSQIASIKMEERTAALNLSRQLLGNFVPNEQWNNNNNNNNDNNSNPNTVNWTDLSNFSSSSTGNHL